MAGWLDGRRALVQGVANRRSLCWGIARALHREGARLCLTYQNERLRENVDELAATLDGTFTLPLDVQRDEELDAVFHSIEQRWGGLDLLVHGAAFARREDLRPEVFADTPREGFHLALDVSVYSLIALARRARPLMKQAGGGAMVCLTYLGSERVVPAYNIMGVAKAALEATVRYLASDLGPDGIRINAVSAGPVRTLAASGVGGITSFIQEVRHNSPLRHSTEPEEVGDAALFLLSPLARGITGSILFVDSGHHVLAAAPTAG